MAKCKTENQLKETYKHIKPYLSDTDDNATELRKMCKNCECYCGKEHDYKECVDNPCFRFYLAYEYLEWINGF